MVSALLLNIVNS